MIGELFNVAVWRLRKFHFDLIGRACRLSWTRSAFSRAHQGRCSDVHRSKRSTRWFVRTKMWTALSVSKLTFNMYPRLWTHCSSEDHIVTGSLIHMRTEHLEELQTPISSVSEAGDSQSLSEAQAFALGWHPRLFMRRLLFGSCAVKD